MDRVVDTNGLLKSALQHFTNAQFLPGPELHRIQTSKLQAVLRQATRHVPMYRDLYREHGISIDGIVNADDLWRLPSVAKEDFLRAGSGGYVDERLKIENLKPLTTSGTQGKMLTIYATEEEAIRMRGSFWAAWIGRGITVNDRLFLTGSPRLARPLPPFKSIFVGSQMPREEILRRFQAFKPTVIIGITECISILARDVLSRDLPERGFVRKIFPSGQTLTVQIKQMIESAFDAEITNLYSSVEASWMAYECERHAGLHLYPERSVIQIARLDDPNQPAAPGEAGQVIVTSLARRTTPFIRYRINDVAALDPTPCPCGRAALRLQSIEGRMNDYLVSTSGQWVAPAVVFLRFDKNKAIADYRVVQETRNHVRASIVPVERFDEAARQQVCDALRHHLGEVEITIDLVKEIPLAASGKRRRIFRAFDLEAPASTSAPAPR